jgi:hypothetical protein
MVEILNLLMLWLVNFGLSRKIEYAALLFMENYLAGIYVL